MAEKILNTRILMKIDTLENWGNSTLKLKEGELAFATVAASAGTGLSEPVVMVKIGTAEEKTFSELPWAFHAKASDVLESAKSEEALTTFINGVIANSGLATDGAMQDLADRVEAAEGDIEVLNGDASTEGSVAKAIADAIAALNLADTYAAKVHGHEIDEVNGLADALAGLQAKGDYAAEEHTHEIDEVNGLADAIADAKKAGTDANAALEAYKGTNDVAVKANADAIAAMKDHESVDSFADVMAEIAKKQDIIPAETYDAYGAAAQALTDAKAYTDEKDEAMGERVDALGEAVAAEKERAEGIEAGLQGAIDAINDADTGILKQAKDYADGKDEAIAAAASAAAIADGKAVTAQNEVDALEKYVGTIPETATATNIVAYVQEKTTGIATEGAMNGLADRVTAVEGDVATIKGDYLKAADKTELSNAIAAEKERAEAAEADLQTQINTIMNNPDTEGVINSINEFTQYIADHGEIAEGFRVDIDANKKAIEDHEALAAQTYETKEDATAKYDELSELIAEKAVQADWNQNDPEAADYIKNRPFYEEEGRVTLYSGTVELTENDRYVDGGTGKTYYATDVEDLFGLDANKSYFIKFNGVEYIPEVVGDEYGVVLYVNELCDFSYFIRTYTDSNYGSLTVLQPGNHSLEISYVDTVVHKIDHKFLPVLDWNNIENRPFYDTTAVTRKVIFDGTVDGFYDNSGEYTTGYGKSIDSPILVDALYEVVYDGVTYSNVYVVENYGYRMLGERQDLGFVIIHRYDEMNNVMFTVDAPGDTHTFKITELAVSGELVQLDDKFISDNIARVADVDTAVAALGEADTAMAGRLDAIEAQLGDGEGSVADMIATAKQEAIDAAAADATSKADAAEAAAKGHADELNTAMNTRVEVLETKVDTGDQKVSEYVAAAMDEVKADSSNKDAVVLAEAQKSIAAVQADLDGKIATKANDADLSAIAKTGSTDDLVQGELVLVFDCGTSAV